MAQEESLKHASNLLSDASHEFARIQAIAWAVDELLTGCSANIDATELQGRVSYLLQTLTEHAGNACSRFDKAAVETWNPTMVTA